MNEANIEYLDVTPNIKRVRMMNDVKDPPTDGQPFNGSPIRPVRLYYRSCHGSNTIGGVGALNSMPLHGVVPLRRSVILSDSSHSIN